MDYFSIITPILTGVWDLANNVKIGDYPLVTFIAFILIIYTIFKMI